MINAKGRQLQIGKSANNGVRRYYCIISAGGNIVQTETIIGIIASSATAASMIPQLIKIVREKKAEDVSLLMPFILLGGLCCWVWYGLLKNDWIIIISNSFSVLVNVGIVIATVKYKTKS